MVLSICMWGPPFLAGYLTMGVLSTVSGRCIFTSFIVASNHTFPQRRPCYSIPGFILANPMIPFVHADVPCTPLQTLCNTLQDYGDKDTVRVYQKTPQFKSPTSRLGRYPLHARFPMCKNLTHPTPCHLFSTPLTRHPGSSSGNAESAAISATTPADDDMT